MAPLRLALAQVNPTIGDIDGNVELVLHWTRQAVERGAHLVAFPEMMLTGYPVEDLALRHSFVTASRHALEALPSHLVAAGLGEIPVVVGYLDDRPDTGPATAAGATPADKPSNAAAWLHRGRVVARATKHHLPNYGVFDEYRNFQPGSTLSVTRLQGVDVALTICEDIWQDGGPVAVTSQAQAGLLLVVNASPFELNKDDVRLELTARRAAEAGCPLAYVNMVGAQDELVFDGDSIVVSEFGQVLARGPQFVADLLVLDLDLAEAKSGAAIPAQPMPEVSAGIQIVRTEISAEPLPSYPPQPGPVAERLTDEAEIYAALVTGVRDYTVKNGFRSVVVALSGGIDSALTATIATDALGAGAVHGISMPSRYSSEHSSSDAADLAGRLGLHYRVVPIEPMVASYLANLELTGLAEENLQARVRGTVLMGLSNQYGHLVLAPGNKSELAVGYTTLYGDSVGGFAPLKDVPKTLVWRLAAWRNKSAEEHGQRPPIPENSISKPPSAELRPGQLDTDSLPPYHLLDDILEDYVEQDRGVADLIAAGFASGLVEQVLRMVDAAEYKRRQYPPGPKISFKAFGRDRRLPITNRWRERIRPGS
ncbi:MAG TPA: NAD+ synthase [Actinomycetes bacterium]|nr:NAD+ synthase [Actinomycetes bacterium]